VLGWSDLLVARQLREQSDWWGLCVGREVHGNLRGIVLFSTDEWAAELEISIGECWVRALA